MFRIDHYLGKETVQNLLALRFANQLFEPVWNAQLRRLGADHDGRGRRHRRPRRRSTTPTGAARDVLQNHLLQLLALTAMEEPVEFAAEAIRIEKIKVLRAISLPHDLEHYAIRGQYDQGWLAGERVAGYRDEKDIPTDSTTETYAAVRLGVETRRWAGVPFYLRTGKRLPRRVTEIAVLFKKAPHLPFSKTDTEELGHNQLVIRVQPDEGVTLQVRLEGARQRDGGPRRRDGLPLRRGVHRVLARGLRAADPRRAARRRDAVPAQRGGRGVLAGDRPARGVLGRARRRTCTAPASGARRRPTRCSPATAAHWRRP